MRPAYLLHQYWTREVIISIKTLTSRSRMHLLVWGTLLAFVELMSVWSLHCGAMCWFDLFQCQSSLRFNLRYVCSMHLWYAIIWAIAALAVSITMSTSSCSSSKTIKKKLVSVVAIPWNSATSHHWNPRKEAFSTPDHYSEVRTNGSKLWYLAWHANSPGFCWMKLVSWGRTRAPVKLLLPSRISQNSFDATLNFQQHSTDGVLSGQLCPSETTRKRHAVARPVPWPCWRNFISRRFI